MNIEQRLSSLESSVRRWRWVSVVLGVLIIVGLALAAAPAGIQPSLTTKELTIVNDKREPVVMLSALPDGTGLIYVYGRTNKAAVNMACKNGAGVVSISSDAGKPLVVLSGNEKGGAIVIADPNGKAAMMLP